MGESVLVLFGSHPGLLAAEDSFLVWFNILSSSWRGHVRSSPSLHGVNPVNGGNPVKRGDYKNSHMLVLVPLGAL